MMLRKPKHPKAPDGLLPATVKRWDVYWRSDAADLVEDIDRAAVERLFGLYDQHARAMQVVAKALAVKGSMGQIRVNPLADYVLKLEGQILRLENELGLTPAARIRMGVGDKVATVEEGSTVDELANRRAARLAGTGTEDS